MSDDTEGKKDLTGLLEQTSAPAEPTAQELAQSSPTSSAPVENFESLEEISSQQPQPSELPQQETQPLLTAEPEMLPQENPLEAVKAYSENLTVGQPVVPAAYPFSLLITGWLSLNEREKLVDLLSRENIGVREVDLEPQFEGGKVLIPRISEYAGVLIVQALRGAQVEIKLGPSDDIFATDDTRDADPFGQQNLSPKPLNQSDLDCNTQFAHPAEQMPVTSDSSLPEIPSFSVVGIVTASASLKTHIVEAERSSEYQEILEALQRELRYKAYRKGASAVLNFSISLNRLTLPTTYKLTVMGTAIKAPKTQTPEKCTDVAM